MSTGAGYLSYFGMKQQSDFRVAVDITEKIPLIDESIKPEFQRIETNYLQGTSGSRPDHQGSKVVAGSTNINLVHDEVDSGEIVGCNLPLAIAMGESTWTAGTGSNQITLANDPSVFATIAFEKSVSVHEVIGAMCKSFSITGSANNVLRGSFEWLGYDYEFASPENESADLSTLPTVDPYDIHFNDLVFRMATDFSDALAAGDQIAIKEFTLNFNSNLTEHEFATPLNSASNPYGTSSWLSMLFERNGLREVTIDLTVPRYTANTWLTAHENDSPIQMDFTFSASATRNFYIYVPYAKITSCPANVTGPEIIPLNISLKCFRGASYDSGVGNTVMKFLDAATTIGEEFAIETDNDRTAAILS